MAFQCRIHDFGHTDLMLIRFTKNVKGQKHRRDEITVVDSAEAVELTSMLAWLRYYTVFPRMRGMGGC